MMSLRKKIKRLVCRIRGHRFALTHFDGRGRRIEVEVCGRCGAVASVLVKPRNRALRRKWARAVAKELAS